MPASIPLAARAAPRSPRAHAWLVIVAAALCAWMVGATPRARALALAALTPTGPSLKFGEVGARRGVLDGQTVLFVEGTLRNDGKTKLKAPTLRVTLVGEDGRPLYAWKTQPAKTDMAPAQEIAFQTRLLAPPESFKSIAISFADAR